MIITSIHVKDHIIHVRFQQIIETPTQPSMHSNHAKRCESSRERGTAPQKEKRKKAINNDNNIRTQELCERRSDRPGLPVPNSPYSLCGRQATLNLK